MTTAPIRTAMYVCVRVLPFPAAVRLLCRAAAIEARIIRESAQRRVNSPLTAQLRIDLYLYIIYIARARSFRGELATYIYTHTRVRVLKKYIGCLVKNARASELRAVFVFFALAFAFFRSPLASFRGAAAAAAMLSAELAIYEGPRAQ